MAPYVDSRDGRSLSIYGSECQIWKTFTTICTAIEGSAREIATCKQNVGQKEDFMH